MIAFLTVLGLALPGYGQSWKDEFDDICSKVNIAHTLSEKQLNDLIERADILIKKLEKMEGLKSRRLYIFRLKKCKNFFQYNLELKRSKTGGTVEDKNSLLAAFLKGPKN